MAQDPRDRYVPKHPTPPAGTRSLTQAEREARSRDHGEEDFDSATPIDMPFPARLDRLAERTKGIAERTRGITTSTTDIQVRVGRVESGLTEANHELARQGIQLNTVANAVEVIAEESRESRREREERERRAETRAEAELERRSKRNMAIIAIVVPTLAAIGALIAGVAAATRGQPAPIVLPSASPSHVETPGSK